MQRSGPFEAHLREALALNRRRAPRYAALSGGASRRISRMLVASEVLLLPVARWLDQRAACYHQAGVPLLDALFVPMHLAPAFGTTAPFALPASYRPPAPLRLVRALASAFRRGAYAGAAEVLEVELARLAAHPGVDAMTRHLLESLRRVCHLAPVSIPAARAHGLTSPGWMLALLVYGHLGAVSFAAWLDGAARPLQVRGLPIVVRDVPPIPAER